MKQFILEGKLFVYPTDTIYGLGCNALDQHAVEKLKQIKARDKDKPLSVIAPSLDWIREHCVVDVDLKKYLPGPYTLVLKKKNPAFLSHISQDTLGVRIPANDFTKLIQSAGVPFVTTSVNLSGMPFAVKISDVSSEILDKVDVIINVGPLTGSPSTLIVGGKEIRR